MSKYILSNYPDGLSIENALDKGKNSVQLTDLPDNFFDSIARLLEIEGGFTVTKEEIDSLGINAATINHLTVNTAVPLGAVFTDTVYNDSAMQTVLNGKQASDNDLTAIAALTSLGLIERTGPGTVTTVTVTQAGKTLLAGSTAAVQRTLLGLGTSAISPSEAYATAAQGILAETALRATTLATVAISWTAPQTFRGKILQPRVVVATTEINQTLAINLNAGTLHDITLGHSGATIQLPAPEDGAQAVLLISGGFVASWSCATAGRIRFPGGDQVELTALLGKTDQVLAVSDGSVWMISLGAMAFSRTIS